MGAVIPDLRWSEPNLLIPGKKPVGLTELRRDLGQWSFYTDFTTGLTERAVNARGSFVGDAAIVGDAGEGRILSLGGSDASIDFGTQIKALDLSLPYTIVSRVKKNPTGVDNYPAVMTIRTTGSTPLLYFYSDAASFEPISLASASDGVQVTSLNTATDVWDGLWHTAVWVFRGGTASDASNYSFYWDGIEQTVAAGTAASVGATNAHSVGEVQGWPNADFDGDMSFVGLMAGRAWSEGEAIEFYRDPYNILKPSRIFIDTAGGGGGIPFNETSIAASDYDWQGYTASIISGFNDVSVAVSDYDWDGKIGIVNAGFQDESSGAQVYHWQGFAGSIVHGFFGEGQTSQYLWTGYAGTLVANKQFLGVGEKGDYEWTGYPGIADIGGIVSFNGISIGPKLYEWTGYPAILITGFENTSVGVNEYLWQGFAGVLGAGVELTGQPGVYEWTGYPGSVTHGFGGSGQPGVYEWTGYPGSVTHGFDSLQSTGPGEYHWRGRRGFFFNGDAPNITSTQINDCIMEALEFYGFRGSLNDRLLQYYQVAGATAWDIDDAAYEFLVGQGIAPSQINDMWVSYFIQRGFPGAEDYNDGMHYFWCINGGAL